jgi:hypothetical protein
MQPDWTQPDKDRLIKRWDELGTISQLEKGRRLQAEFPGRSPQALYVMHYQLTGGKETHQRKTKQPTPNKETEKNQPEQSISQIYFAAKVTEIIKDLIKPLEENIKNLEARVYGEQTVTVATLNQLLQPIKEKLADISMDKQNELKIKIEDLETTMGEYMVKFEEHEHSEKTGKPLVPP